ncbi:putative exported protein [Natrarchaeobaculum sulfurireducens]|uniref:ABC-type phosphate/phosphonate transport system,periplasmic component n=2 Tax=Natrarchaeobaculum sulfurireducens TaxID=2044521 RepID=A0A346PJV7_9EURY|nr:ABC-type phosphate/phosphonate transport system,periplasmic component [Natrarchaeobaculum sulfurireducens]AXR83539.1 putative exported protein [Natrarchaeobaculum sulfurireducens]
MGALGAVGLAGCLGDDDDNGSGNGDGFPTDSLTWMIPWSEGGGTDTYARQILPGMEGPLDQSVDVDNRPGAGSMVGTEWLSTQDPDGYTFGTVNSAGAHFTWAAEGLEDSFHIEEDFEPISYAGTFGYTLIVNRDLGEEYGIEDYGALRDAYADGDISGFGYQGAGSDSHLATLLLRDDYGLEYDNSVPYDGGGPTSEAVQSGEVAAGFATNTSAIGAEESGEAYTVVNLMDIEVDATEMGEDLDMITNYGDSMAWLVEFTQTQLAPAGTPEEERQIISEAVEVGVNSDSAQEWAEDTGNILEYGDMDAAEEAWTGIVEEQEQQVEDAIGGFDAFNELAEEES